MDRTFLHGEFKLISETNIGDIKLENEPEKLTKQREVALNKYNSLTMPTSKEEDWKYTDLKNFDLDSYDLIHETINFVFAGQKENQNVVFIEMKNAMKVYSDLILEYLQTLSSNKILEMQKALWTNGIFIYIPKNVIVKEPLQNLFNITGNGATISQTIIILEEGAQVTYFEDYSSLHGNYDSLRNSFTNIICKPNSILNM